MAIIIPSTKSEIIADVNATSAGTLSTDVIIENDAVSFVVLLEDVPSNLSIEVFELKNNKPIAPPALITGTLTGSGISKRFAKVVDNKIRFVIGYDGPANFTIIAKAATAQAVTIVNDQASGALAGEGLEGAKLAGATPIKVCVGDEPLEGRALVVVHNASQNTMFWGRTPNVNSATGIPLYKDQMASWAFTDTANIYIMTPAQHEAGILKITESKLYVE